MAKSSKKMSDVPASESGSVAPSDGSTQANGTTKPAKQAKTKSAAQKTRKTTPRAKVSDKPPQATSDKEVSARKPRSPRKAAPREPFTDDDIRIRAYFIAQHRTREGIPGSSADDWLEARRQLQAEANGRA
jgi:hypothetical protein